MKIIASIYFLLFATTLFIGCRKNDVKNIVVGKIDTTEELTKHRWEVVAIWFDNNGNGIIDSSSEYKPHSFNGLLFQPDGALYDTVEYASDIGYWYYKSTVSRDSIYYADIYLNKTLVTIVSITDSTLILNAAQFSPKEWVFLVKY